MCGIHAVISSSAHDPGIQNCISDELRRRLCNRGPDHFDQVVTEYNDDATGTTSRRVRLCLTSTVLSLRGDGVTAQPFRDETTGSVLCWNGEAWKTGDDHHVVVGNDGEAVFRLLLLAASGCAAADREQRHVHVAAALRSVVGPFAFAYFDKPAGRMYFGRDRLGRRSLLIRRDEHGSLVLSSVSENQDPRWKEVEADGIYVADVQQFGLPGRRDDDIVRYPWTDGGAPESLAVSGIGPFNASTEPAAGSCTLVQDSPSVRCLHDRLRESLRLRVLGVPKPPSAAAAQQDTRIAILFSGGLDCSVLARMSHELLPPDQGIDLINVAFENPRVASHLGAGITDVYEACPDRITGRKSFSELRRVCPARRWRFIAVNVPYAQTVAHRPSIISIMHPHNTEMDLSIASALYFAARGTGHGTAKDVPSDGLCSTPARVLLSGLGADELFGGYGRHAVAFSRSGYAGLVEELQLDVARLGKRNLGRDDRVMAHWGKEARFPYLDEDLVRWAMQLPAWEKCDFASAGDGASGCVIEPAKRVLRLVALSLGMDSVAHEKKRAIQFGARTAKMESGRVKGTAPIC